MSRVVNGVRPLADPLTLIRIVVPRGLTPTDSSPLFSTTYATRSTARAAASFTPQAESGETALGLVAEGSQCSPVS